MSGSVTINGYVLRNTPYRRQRYSQLASALSRTSRSTKKASSKSPEKHATSSRKKDHHTVKSDRSIHSVQKTPMKSKTKLRGILKNPRKKAPVPHDLHVKWRNPLDEIQLIPPINSLHDMN